MRDDIRKEGVVMKSKKTPYQGLWVFLLMMILPSLAITSVLYCVIARWQARFGVELNWATAKIFGFGCGILFHISCWLMGVFTEDYLAMKCRMKEFFANMTVSASLAFSCYWDDVKTLGLAYWIDVAVIALNAGIFIDAVLNYLALRGA